MTNITRLSISHPRIENAESIEDILCLATLIANGELSTKSTLEDSAEFYKNEAKSYCGNCPFNLTCLACIINE